MYHIIFTRSVRSQNRYTVQGERPRSRIFTEAEMALSVPQYYFKKLTYQSPLSRNVYLRTSFRKYFNKHLNITYLLKFASIKIVCKNH